LSLKVRDDELKALMKMMDKDGSGSVNFKEFSLVMADQFYKKPTQKELEAAFDYFDQGIKNFFLYILRGLKICRFFKFGIEMSKSSI